jgi:hypothetical protein
MTERDRSHESLADHINFFAEHEGWAIVGGVICAIEEMEAFKADNEAVAHVSLMASCASTVHKAALETHDDTLRDCANLIRARVCERWVEWAKDELFAVAMQGHGGFIDAQPEELCGSYAQRYGLDHLDDPQLARALAVLRKYV